MKTEPQKEHRWLHRLVGEWTYETEAACEPGKPPEKLKGTESVRSVGGLWVLTSHTLGDDGKWRQFMTANYRRR